QVKILLQMQGVSMQIPEAQRYKGMIDCFLRIPKEQGFLTLWRGNLGTIVAKFPGEIISFATKDIYKDIFMKNVDQKSQYWRSLFGNLAVGSAAGATSLGVTYPLSFTRTRLAADVGKGVAERQFQGHVDCIKNIFKSDGIRGLYKGFGTSILGIMVYRGVYFGLYDFAKAQTSINSVLSSFGLGMGVTITAGIISYPLDTVRVRLVMQSGRKVEEILYKNTYECFKKMLIQEGPRSLYYGLLPTLIKGSFGGLILVIYDKLSKRKEWGFYK
ncbi:unnamed protein product, partial [Meganyctiphanes norvegica]